MPELVTKYQQYEEYKDSGVEWLGDIPSDWKAIRVKYIADTVSTGGTPKESFSFTLDPEVCWFSPGDFHDGQVLRQANKYVTWKSINVKDSKIYKENSVLVIGIGATLGKVAHCSTPFSCNQQINVITPNRSISSFFLMYSLLVQNEQMSISSNASTIGIMNQEKTKDLFLTLPDRIEQDIIVSFLDHETAQIDTLIDKQQTLIQLLKEKRQAVISHAVTKGLNPDAPMTDSGVEWLGEVPEHWTIPQIGYHSKVTKLTGFEYTNLWRPNMEGKIIALRGFNIQERYLDLSKTERITEELSNKLARSKLYEGDIVLPCTGTLGNAALIQENNLYHINQNIAKVTINSELFNTEFTVFWMTSLPFRQMIEFNNTSGMQPVLLIGDIRKLPIPLLPLDEQQEIVDFLLLKTEQFDRLIGNAEKAIQLMQERRTALISAAVTGKIDVRGWQAPD